LKLSAASETCTNNKVLEQNPSKQGLKQTWSIISVVFEIWVLEQNPSKQGLKQRKP